jgi:uncharacterized protein
METLTSSMDRFALQWAKRVVSWRWYVIVATVVCTAGLCTGLQYLSISTDYSIFFSKENPELRAFQEFQSEYNKNDNILFVVKPKNGRVFTPQNITAIEQLTEGAWQLPYVLRVDSVTNFQHSWAKDDDIIVDDLVRDGHLASLEELQQKEAIALAEPLLKNNLLAADGLTTGINVTLQYPQKSITEAPLSAKAARELRESILAKHPDLEIAITGIAMLNNAFGEASQNDMATLVPLMYAVMIIVMIVTLRSVTASFSTLSVVILATLWGMGFAGWSHISMTPISFTAPTIIMTLAIADSIHLMVNMLNSMRGGKNKIDALQESITVNFVPVTITSLTTVIGFLSLNFSDSPPFWHLGNIAAFGIFSAWLLSLCFVPALVAVLPVKVKVDAQSNTIKSEIFFEKLAIWVCAHSRKLLFLCAGASLLLIIQIPKIQLNDDFIRYFDERITFRSDSEFAIKNLNGIYLVEYSLGAGEEGGVSEPVYLSGLEKFSQWLREQPEVRHVFSYADIIKRLNKNMHGDDAAYYRIPENRDMAAQLLFMYENSLPGGSNLTDRIKADKSATRVTVTIDDMTAKEGIAFFERSENWIKQNLPEAMWTKPTSVSVMFSYISQRNIQSMLGGNAMALVLIAVVMMLALRSFGLGLLSLIPNSLPLLAMFGLWALVVGQVGMAAATVSATALGIIVDDTIHLLAKYLRGRRNYQLDKPAAIRYAFKQVGLPVVITTVILALGFSALMLSSFLINSQMGLLTTIAIVFALVMDLVMLPALLLINFSKKDKVYENQLAT